MLSHIEEVRREVSGWDGISVAPHRFGGVEFNLGRVEVGHVHSSGLVDIPFPRRVRDQLLVEGLASEHHVLPNSGWVSFRVRSKEDVPRAIWLRKLSYLRSLLRRTSRSQTESDQGAHRVLEGIRALNLSAGLAAALDQRGDAEEEER